MRRLLVLIITIISIALVGPVLAQPAAGGSGGAQPGGMGPGMSPRGGRSAAKATVILIHAYNPQTVTTVKGGVESLGTFPPQSRWAGVIRSAVLKTEQGKITVYLAPDSFLQEQKVSLKAGDELAATGSKVSLGQLTGRYCQGHHGGRQDHHPPG
ncbi:MAG: hypothetical protein HY790_06225 [Deltaproteobacteria bacterium]|nr:hypothetical protein [Deltaproteobacteria bacterium]